MKHQHAMPGYQFFKEDGSLDTEKGFPFGTNIVGVHPGNNHMHVYYFQGVKGLW
jgi:hypothetical protein